MEVIELKKKFVNEDLVKLLEDLLRRAKAGDLQSIAGIGVLANLDTITFKGLSVENNLFTLIGLAENLKFLLLDMVEN